MGDRFYQQQKDYKPKRVLKKDIIPEIEAALECEIQGLDKCTVATLETLARAVCNKLSGR